MITYWNDEIVKYRKSKEKEGDGGNITHGKTRTKTKKVYTYLTTHSIMYANDEYKNSRSTYLYRYLWYSW